MYNFDPLAQANYYNSYVRTGLSNDDAKKIVTSVGIQTGLAFIANMKINPFKSKKW
ncbi:hypothetical protein SAMN04515674_108187 [Pseudarcicella hirudinis]|uniref:Uncharacterized protein n=1 Tax=Pseudarcicella hirudinis TaxID=1079859 RepID=A0A1I5V488_9BACT|nr:hypothetical protein SAMN04515674_108187 [Pseudarcicella hirudinis]